MENKPCSKPPTRQATIGPAAFSSPALPWAEKRRSLASVMLAWVIYDDPKRRRHGDLLHHITSCLDHKQNIAEPHTFECICFMFETTILTKLVLRDLTKCGAKAAKVLQPLAILFCRLYSDQPPKSFSKTNTFLYGGTHGCGDSISNLRPIFCRPIMLQFRVIMN